MEKNKWILKAGLVVIGITLVLCLIADCFLRLKEPVFMKHYYDVPLSDNQQPYTEGFTLQYITNINDNNRVTGISFKELPEVMFEVYDQQPGSNFLSVTSYNAADVGSQGIQAGRYSIRTVHIILGQQDIDAIKPDQQISQAVISFNNGEIQEADIGKVVFYQPQYSDQHIDQRSVTISSGGKSSNECYIKKNIIIDEIQSHLFEEVKDVVEIKIDDKELSEVKGNLYKKGAFLSIQMSQHYDSCFSQFTFWDVRPVFLYHDEEGNRYRERFYNIDNRYHDYNSINVIKYLLKRGVL